MFYTCHIAYIGSPRELDHTKDQAAIRHAVNGLATDFPAASSERYSFYVDKSQTAEWLVCVVYVWERSGESPIPCTTQAKQVISAYPLHVFFSEDPHEPLPSYAFLSPSPPIVSLVAANHAFVALPPHKRRDQTSTFTPETLDDLDDSSVLCFWYRGCPEFCFLALLATNEDETIQMQPSRHDTLHTARERLVSWKPLATSFTPLWHSFLEGLEQETSEMDCLRNLATKDREEIEELTKELGALRKETAALALTKEKIRQELGERRLALKGLKTKIECLRADLEAIKA